MKRPRMQIRQRRKGLSERAERRRDTDKHELAVCTGKRRLTEADTRQAIAYVERATGYKAQAYPCRYGDHFHVGKVKRKMPNGVVVIERVKK